MSSKNKKHIHKYHRLQSGSQFIWFCALGDCQHFMPKHYEVSLPGKNSFCWECGEEMILNTDNMKEDKPRCDKCRGLVTDDLIQFIESQGIK